MKLFLSVVLALLAVYGKSDSMRMEFTATPRPAENLGLFGVFEKNLYAKQIYEQLFSSA